MTAVREAKASAPDPGDGTAPRPGTATAGHRPRVVSGRVVRTRSGVLSLRVRGRAVVVTAALLAALVAVAGTTLTTGDFDLSVGEVLKALTG
ncbi:hypothetical protein GTW71_31215, partial [Streptomyces sp. SID6041]|nr:hypothetical protein [Streptomyces sp. SID6041]